MTGCVFPELLVLWLDWVGGGEGLVVVAEAGAALAVDPPLLPAHPVQLILLRLVARCRLLLGVQVVVEVVVRIKVAAARGLQVAKIGIFHFCLEMQICCCTCVNGFGGGFIFPFLWSDLQEINSRFLCNFSVERRNRFI